MDRERIRNTKLNISEDIINRTELFHRFVLLHREYPQHLQ
jgi:hypothetical protein